MSRLTIFGVLCVGCLLALSGCAAEPLDDSTETDVENDTEPEETTEIANETVTEEDNPVSEEPENDSNESNESQNEPPAENESRDGTESETDTETPTNTPKETESGTDAETATETETETETTTETETETTTETETETTTETETETTTETETETETEGETETDAPETDTPTETEDETETDTPTETEQTEVENETETETTEEATPEDGEINAASLTISVVDASSGEPIEGAEVYGILNGGGPALIDHETDADGTVSVHLETGEYQISIRHDEYNDDNVEYVHEEDGELVVELEPISETHTEVVVVDPDTGEPVPNGRVVVEGGVSATADENGVAQVELEPGEHTIYASDSSVEWRSEMPGTTVTIDESTDRVEVEAVTMPDKCEVDIEVIDQETGEPIPDISVIVDVGAEYVQGHHTTSRTNEDGIATVEAYCGEWSIDAMTAGYRSDGVVEINASEMDGSVVTVELVPEESE